MIVLSKGNGKNYYLIDADGIYHEIVKVRGAFYRTKYVIGEGLRAIGDPLTQTQFTLVES